MTTILVLGAEAQAATSLALAYPDCLITFVSSREILDGFELANVRMVHAKPGDALERFGPADEIVPLCPRWLLDRDNSLTATFGRLERKLPGSALPLAASPQSQGKWIVKGDLWHRPDNPLSGDAGQLHDVVDTHGCGLVYQPWCHSKATIMAIGRRQGHDAVLLGIVRVYEERFFWDAILQAAETIEAPDVVRASLDVLDALDHRGFFTLNWLRTDEGLRLSSFRPVPRAVFQAFKRGGLDLLESVSTVKVAAAGIKFIADPHYASFQRLVA